MPLACRVATFDDLDRLRVMIGRAIDRLQSDFLTPAQVRASHRLMGIDTQLIRDGTYFMVCDGADLAGCGGWSFRTTLFGGDNSLVAREPRSLDPATDAARIRAMYTDPDHVRKGVGRTVLRCCEASARERGFRRAEMMATLAGEPLYAACGYARLEAPIDVPSGDDTIPLVRMGRSLDDDTLV